MVDCSGLYGEGIGRLITMYAEWRRFANDKFHDHTGDSVWLNAAKQLVLADEDKKALQAFHFLNNKDNRHYVKMVHGGIINVGNVL